MARTSRRLRSAGAAAVIGITFLASGCGSGGGASLAHEVCTEVAKAARLERQAQRDPEEARALRARIVRLLQVAAPNAMVASSDNSNWDALSANLNEVGRLPVRLIFPGLRADCAPTGVKGT